MRENSEAKARAKILIVDDEKFVLDLFKEIFTPRDYDAEFARDPIRGLELIRERDFDVIISDFRMPGMSGEEFYLKAKKIKPGIEKRFIFTSGEMDPVRKRRFIKKTGAAVISKPFRVEEVRNIVSSLLKEKSAD